MSNLRRRNNTILANLNSAPSWGSAYRVLVLEPGAVATSGSVGTTVTVRAGHGFAVNDYLMVGTTESSFVRVDGVTATTLTIASARTVSAGDYLVNLGTDTGTSTPNYDGSGVSIYDEPSGAGTALTNSKVTASSVGAYGYWTRERTVWEVILSSTETPVSVVPDVVLSESAEIDHGSVTAFTDADATPDVSGGIIFKTANTGSTTITNFDSGTTGQEIIVLVQDANTTFDFTGTNLKGNSGSDWTAGNGDWLRAVYDGTNWYCSVHDCTA